MKVVVMLLLLTPLGGCMVTDRYVANEAFYTRSEIDAINSENQCKLMARNMVQIYRCGVRR